ncbi:MAG: hypothetical protein LH702_01150 [Phormidesmis sp. CAN_BIN44]|nr:hypothetical protein [Phormidesmis sp. CAN_BIN44]
MKHRSGDFSDILLELDGEIAGDTIAGKGIRVIRVNPTQDGQIAVGKENGEIELWQTSPPRLEKKLFQSTDRVFDLAFTQNAETLFSAHGSGTVRRWDIKDSTLGKARKQIPELSIKTAITSLAISEAGSTPYVLIAGEYNRFLLWKQNDQFAYEVPYNWKSKVAENDLSNLFTKNDYIY